MAGKGQRGRVGEGERGRSDADSIGVPLQDVVAVGSIDEVIHQKARLGIMSTLMALGEADFKLLKETLGLSDGNLSTHLRLLEENGYVDVRKEFRGRKPHTSAVATSKGRQAFTAYLEALEQIIKAAKRS